MNKFKSEYISISDYNLLIDKQCKQLLKIIKKNNILLITAESLTAGMIVSSLVNQPETSSNIYGGVATYFTEAKRRFLNVKEKNVYTHRSAKEMAEGSLKIVEKDKPNNNLIGISVTGHAGPYYDWRENKNKGINPVNNWGKIHIGISVLMKNKNNKKNIKQTLNIPKSTSKLNESYDNTVYTDIKPYGNGYLKTSTIGLDICNMVHLQKKKMSHKKPPKFCISIKNKTLKLTKSQYDGTKKNSDGEKRIMLRNIIRKCSCLLAINMAIDELSLSLSLSI